jgi:hypothetical protein
VHRMWLDLTRQPGFDKLHHHDIVSVALTRLAREYGRDREEILKDLRKSLAAGGVRPALPPSSETPDGGTEQPKGKEPRTPPITGP